MEHTFPQGAPGHAPIPDPEPPAAQEAPTQVEDFVPQPDAGEEGPRTGKKKKRLLLGGLILGGFLLAFGVAAFTVIQNPPARLVQFSLNRLSSLSSLEYQGEVTVTAAAVDEGAEVQITVSWNGVSAQRNTPDHKSQTELALTGSGFDVRTETRSFGLDLFYVRLLNFGLPPDLTEFIAPVVENIEKVQGTWVKIDFEELREFLGEEPSSETPENLFTREERDRLNALLSKAVNLSLVDTEEVAGKSAYHYRAAFERPALDAFLQEFTDIVAQKDIAPEYEEVDFEEAKREVPRLLDEFFETTELDVEFWVGRWDFVLNRVLVTIRPKETAEEAAEAFRATVSVTMSEPQTPPVIEEPQDAKALQEVLRELFGELGALSSPVGPEDAGGGGADEARKAHLQQYALLLEDFRQQRGAYPSTDNALSRLTEENVASITPCKELLEANPETPPEFVVLVCPADPAGPQRFYGYRSDGTTYELTAVLDNAADHECVIEEPAGCIYRIRDGNVVSMK